MIGCLRWHKQWSGRHYWSDGVWRWPVSVVCQELCFWIISVARISNQGDINIYQNDFIWFKLSRKSLNNFAGLANIEDFSLPAVLFMMLPCRLMFLKTEYCWGPRAPPVLATFSSWPGRPRDKTCWGWWSGTAPWSMVSSTRRTGTAPAEMTAWPGSWRQWTI